ncbi:AMP-dependent synthetase and ligase [Paenibacillus sp. PL91]|uniref:AMP-dependent synthetase and ligase n=1 Tax=Paenibacillus sp. PL91 TaxID=2729538 RepID=UPI001659FB86|nr:AMP-dependent synthetase and ligase [Paenibacillus sp. PL91]MBC9200147.1 AMP-dependent synthetase and ligase [Paenibacillus sp. PL91]
MNQFQPNNQISQQLAHAEQMIQQLIQQTNQASAQYQQLLKQEQNNAVLLEQIAQREQQAAHIIQTALQGHQTAIQQLHQISSICNQIANSSYQQAPMAFMNTNNQSTGYSNYSSH